MRLFLAIDLPRDVKLALGRRTSELRVSFPKARWVRPRNLHLTLVFLGEVEDGALGAIERRLRSICAAEAPMAARLGAGGAFPGRGRASVLWAGVETDRDLSPLHRRLEEGLASIEIGGRALYEPEARAFRPHVTLARCRPAWPRRQARRWIGAFGTPGLPFTVDRVELFESRLTPAGPVYRGVCSSPLGQPPAVPAPAR